MRSRLILAALVLMPLLGGCDESGPSISGTITMAPEMQKKLGASDTLFVVAKAKDQPGPPLAVLRIVGMKFPLDYKLTQDDVLRPNTPFTGEVTIAALIRKSGSVGMKTPGDLEGAFTRPVAVGTQDVDFALDKVLK
jgi:cytochrome c-type biogenesis protein CcmH